MIGDRGLWFPTGCIRGPFPHYGPGAVVAGSDVIMVTSPSKDIVSNYGRGLIFYALDDTATLDFPGQTLETNARGFDQATVGAEDLPVLGLSMLSDEKKSMYQAASTLGIRNRQALIKRC